MAQKLDLYSNPLNPQRVVGAYHKLMISSDFISQSKPGELASENFNKIIMKIGARFEELYFFCMLPNLNHLTDFNDFHTGRSLRWLLKPCMSCSNMSINHNRSTAIIKRNNQVSLQKNSPKFHHQPNACGDEGFIYKPKVKLN